MRQNSSEQDSKKQHEPLHRQDRVAAGHLRAKLRVERAKRLEECVVGRLRPANAKVTNSALRQMRMGCSGKCERRITKAKESEANGLVTCDKAGSIEAMHSRWNKAKPYVNFSRVSQRTQSANDMRITCRTYPTLSKQGAGSKHTSTKVLTGKAASRDCAL
eukprot:6181524-Pleurochrysis_carterae.AAC.4